MSFSQLVVEQVIVCVFAERWESGLSEETHTSWVDWKHIAPTAWPQLPGAPSARRTTSRPTADAPSWDARWVRATRAHTGRPSARTAGEPMGCGRMPVLPRERPACPPGDGGHHPLHAGREGLQPQRCPNMRPQLPRGRKRWARWGPRRGSSPARRVWRSRRPGGGVQSVFCLLLFVFLIFLLSGRYGEKEIGEPY